MASTNPNADCRKSVCRNNLLIGEMPRNILLSRGIIQFLFVVALILLIPKFSDAQQQQQAVKTYQKVENFSDQRSSEVNAKNIKPVKSVPVVNWSRRQSSNSVKLPVSNRTVQTRETGSADNSNAALISKLGDQIKNTQSKIEYATAHPSFFSLEDISKMRDAVSAKQKQIAILKKQGN